MCTGEKGGHVSSGKGWPATGSLVALATALVALLPFVVPAAGWTALFTSSAVRGTDAAWRAFVEATSGTIVGYGLIVILVPLLSLPFFATIVIATLAASGIAGRATKAAFRLFSTRRSSDQRRVPGLASPFARWPVHFRLLEAARIGHSRRVGRLSHR